MGDLDQRLDFINRQINLKIHGNLWNSLYQRTNLQGDWVILNYKVMVFRQTNSLLRKETTNHYFNSEEEDESFTNDC